MCPTCGHAPVLHVPDGLGSATCVACVMLRSSGNQDTAFTGICTEKFVFKLTRSEMEQAMVASKDSYPQRTECIECGMDWLMHKGYLCPDGNSTFVPLVNS